MPHAEWVKPHQSPCRIDHRVRAKPVGALLGAFLCIFAVGATAEPRGSQPPNIILIVADDLGWGALGAYGQKTVPARTPTIDQLAADGVRFSQFYAGSSVCAPSRCSLMTGRDTGSCAVRGNQMRTPMPPNEPTIATQLKDLGYRTALIGKWALGSNQSAWAPRSKGFDYFFGFTDQVKAHNYYPEWVWENEERYRLRGNRANHQVAVEKETYINDVFVEKALVFLEENQGLPMFLYLPLTLPHTNSELGVLLGNGHEAPRNYYQGSSELNALEQAHASMVREIDNTVAAVVGKLHDLSLEEHSVVFVTSDNGSAPYYDRRNRFNENGGLRGKKNNLYEGGIRVPLVVWGPAYADAGRVVDTPAAAWDLLPTITELGGGPAPRERPGVSFSESFRGASDIPVVSDRSLYWELHRPTSVIQAVRSGDWKLILTGGEDDHAELFNLASDPQESVNLAPRHPEVVRALTEQIGSLRTASPDWPLITGVDVAPPDVEERPRAGFDAGLPSGVPTQGPIHVLEIDGPGGNHYRSHLYYWSQGRAESLELFRKLQRTTDKQAYLDETLLPLLRSLPAEEIVVSMRSDESPNGENGEAFRRFLDRHGWLLNATHRYRDRYTSIPDIGLYVLSGDGSDG